MQEKLRDFYRLIAVRNRIFDISLANAGQFYSG